MKMYPAIPIDQDAYRAALGQLLHDAFAVAVLELTWHGTVDYLPFIARDGLNHQRELLAKIRSGLAYWKSRADDVGTSARYLQDEVKRARKSPKGRAGAEYLVLAGQRVAVDQCVALAKTLSDELPGIQKQIEVYRDLDRRLELAILCYMAQHPGRSLVASPVPQNMAITLRQNVKMPTVNVSGTLKKKAAQ